MTAHGWACTCQACVMSRASLGTRVPIVSAHEHVHNAACDRVATIRYTIEGAPRSWSIGAFCDDDENSARAHLAKWRPAGVFKSVSFTPACRR